MFYILAQNGSIIFSNFSSFRKKVDKSLLTHCTRAQRKFYHPNPETRKEMCKQFITMPCDVQASLAGNRKNRYRRNAAFDASERCQWASGEEISSRKRRSPQWRRSDITTTEAISTASPSTTATEPVKTSTIPPTTEPAPTEQPTAAGSETTFVATKGVEINCENLGLIIMFGAQISTLLHSTT